MSMCFFCASQNCLTFTTCRVSPSSCSFNPIVLYIDVFLPHLVCIDSQEKLIDCMIWWLRHGAGNMGHWVGHSSEWYMALKTGLGNYYLCACGIIYGFLSLFELNYQYGIFFMNTPRNKLQWNFLIKIQKFHSGKCIWKCCLENGGHCLGLNVLRKGEPHSMLYTLSNTF